MPLEEAVHKCSGKSAARFGLADRGVVREGAFADLVVFDAEQIGDRATYGEPQQTSRGVECVVVNGTVIMEAENKPVSLKALPGRYLRMRR